MTDALPRSLDGWRCSECGVVLLDAETPTGRTVRDDVVTCGARCRQRRRRRIARGAPAPFGVEALGSTP